jgi:uncharacterized FlaG/YvyC family protein
MLKKIGAMMGSPAFSTGASIVGGFLGNRGQRAANAANAQLAHNQIQFQERMSRTAYQRQVEDMKAAGINPMLSAKMGGASTPSGQTAVMQNTAKAGIEGAMMVANLKNMQATARKTNAEAENIENTAEDYQKATNMSNRGLAYELRKKLAKLNVDIGGVRYQGKNYYDQKLAAETAKMRTDEKRSIFMLNGTGESDSPLAIQVDKIKQEFLRLNADRSIREKEERWWELLKAVGFGKDVLSLFKKPVSALGSGIKPRR